MRPGLVRPAGYAGEEDLRSPSDVVGLDQVQRLLGAVVVDDERVALRSFERGARARSLPGRAARVGDVDARDGERPRAIRADGVRAGPGEVDDDRGLAVVGRGDRMTGDAAP